VKNFCELVGEMRRKPRAAAIGPITAASAKRCGFEVVVSPGEFTIPALIEAIRDYFMARRGGEPGSS
jgi:uroporphyrinogen-III synthase